MPSHGRFLTKDPVRSYNRYAYCGNNPVNLIDTNGNLAFPGQIHNLVVDYIAKNKEYYKEQTIYYKSGKWGRADLIRYMGRETC